MSTAGGATAMSATAKGSGEDQTDGNSAAGLFRRLTRGTVLSSIFILLTTCIGAGTLSLPFAISKGGILIFSIVFFVIMVCSALS